METREHFDLNQYQERTKKYLEDLMQVSSKEREYMDRFVSGEYRPELLFDDVSIVTRIENHPMALWKCTVNRKK